MLIRVCNKSNNNYLIIPMYHIVECFVNVYKRLLKVTLCELLWTVLTFCVFLIIWTWKNDAGIVKSPSQNPVILWWTGGFPGTAETRHCPNNIQCDVFSNRIISNLYNVEAYLFYGSNIDFNNLPLPRRPKDIIWGLYHEESPRNVEELANENLLKIFNFSSTYSRYSDVQFPLQYLDMFNDITNTQYFVQTAEKNILLKEISPIMYLQSDCETSTERDAYVKELMKFISIDSYGACLKNKEMPMKFTENYLNNLNEDEFLKFIARYKFVVAIENGVCEDYVTEKFWRAIKVGTVPIYFGSPSIRDWFPNNKSAILLDDFPTPKILSEHINILIQDDRMYEEYLEHKTEQIVTNERIIEEYRLRPHQMDVREIVDKFECFICKQLHDKKKGEVHVNVVNKSHYNCPKPVSAITLQVNPNNNWVFSWNYAMKKAEQIYKTVMSEK